MEKRYINIQELSEYLGLSVNTLYAWVWMKKIPHTKLGRLVKFDLRAIDHWAEKSTIKAQEI
ncbi:helix-turn-helix domain-containing protein [Candidatus Pacearchaeota archaeon]|nr:helix-turn-helix domain-containing protein [Candidatus Pacearchaeota archaeon]